MKVLKVAPTLSLPLDAATETFGILAKKGAGKSNAAVVMAEEMYDAGIPWVAIDPKGDWWGLRSSGDGKRPGLPLPVFGGRHGDIPLEASAGEMMADLILSEMLTCVLDVSEFSKGEVEKFLTSFADRFYRQARDEPIHLFLEEAHEYLPQRVMRDGARLVGAWQKIVKQGRFKGIGCTLISQRSASLNKDVLTQVDTLIVLRTTSPQDRAAVKGWVDVHAESHEMLDALPSLENGEAYIWSPEFLKTLKKVRFRKRRTFDSGATPKVGESKRPPATLADVDLDAIRTQMADTIEKAKESDPRELKKRIKELERQLVQKPVVEVERVVEVEVVDYQPFVPSWIPVYFHKIEGELQDMLDALRGFMGTVDQMEVSAPSKEGFVNPQTDPAYLKAQRMNDRVEKATRAKSERIGRQKAAHERATVESNGEVNITGGALRMLQALGQHHELVVTRSMLGTLAKLKSSSGTFSNYLSILRTQGLIEVTGKEVKITEQGMDFLGNDIVEPMTSEELQDQWRGVLSGGAKRMFDHLLDVYPESLTRTELAEAVDLSPSSGTFSNYLSILRTNNLIEDEGQSVRSSDTLFLL